LELFENTGKDGITARGRTPANVGNFDVLLGKVQGEYLKPNVDDAWRRREQISLKVVIPFDHFRISRLSPAFSGCPEAKFGVNNGGDIHASDDEGEDRAGQYRKWGATPLLKWHSSGCSRGRCFSSG
jgi:hypothetical protein